MEQCRLSCGADHRDRGTRGPRRAPPLRRTEAPARRSSAVLRLTSTGLQAAPAHSTMATTKANGVLPDNSDASLDATSEAATSAVLYFCGSFDSVHLLIY